jgi:hypothetical protein
MDDVAFPLDTADNACREDYRGGLLGGLLGGRRRRFRPDHCQPRHRLTVPAAKAPLNSTGLHLRRGQGRVKLLTTPCASTSTNWLGPCAKIASAADMTAWNSGFRLAAGKDGIKITPGC